MNTRHLTRQSSCSCWTRESPKLRPTQNARQMQARAVIARRAQLEELKNLREQIASQSPDELRAAKTKAQLARIDAEIDGALDRRNFDLVKQLSDIKARLWPLCTTARRPKARQKPRSASWPDRANRLRTPQGNLREIKHFSEIPSMLFTTHETIDSIGFR